MNCLINMYICCNKLVVSSMNYFLLKMPLFTKKRAYRVGHIHKQIYDGSTLNTCVPMYTITGHLSLSSSLPCFSLFLSVSVSFSLCVSLSLCVSFSVCICFSLSLSPLADYGYNITSCLLRGDTACLQ